jgi:alpha-galactosidase
MLCLEGLNKDATYQLRYSDKTYSGNVLMNYGVCAEKLLSPDGKAMQDFSGRLLIFDKQ